MIEMGALIVKVSSARDALPKRVIRGDSYSWATLLCRKWFPANLRESTRMRIDDSDQKISRKACHALGVGAKGQAMRHARQDSLHWCVRRRPA